MLNQKDLFPSYDKHSQKINNLWKNNTLENILSLWSDIKFSASRHDHAIEMFLAKHPNGEVWKDHAIWQKLDNYWQLQSKSNFTIKGLSVRVANYKCFKAFL